MAESYGYYSYGDVKTKWLQGTPSMGSTLNNPNTQMNLVSKNAFSSKTEISKDYDTTESFLTVSKNALCNGTSLVKSANTHFNSTEINVSNKEYMYDIRDTKNILLQTNDIGFYEITTSGQIARHDLTIISTPSESIVKINDVEQSSYNGYETEEINYEVSYDGYKTKDGIVILSNDIELNIELLLEVHLTINVNPENAIVTVNDIEGKEHTFGKGDEVNVKITCGGYKTYTNIFIIEEDTVLDVELQPSVVTVVYPGSTLPSGVTISGIGTSTGSAFVNSGSNLYSQSGSYNVNNGSSYAYIKFKTPNTSTTLSVQAYTSSEPNYDFGAVYVGTKSYSPTQSQMKSGTTDGYGSYLVRTSGNNSSYSTYSMTLNANTTYYINLKYAKDGSGHTGNDRFYIRNITFTVDGG